MKTNNPTSKLTRRSAFGLILAGIALPSTRALAMRDVFVRSKPHILLTPIVLSTCGGESFTARFDSDLTAGANGSARGYLRFDFGDGSRADYAPEVGGLDFDPAGQPIRARVLLRLRRSAGRVAQDFAFLIIEPDASEDCLIYTTIGTQVNPGPLRFDVPGEWTVRR